MLVALDDRLAIVDTDTGTLESLADIPHAHPGLRANDGAVDPDGRFWVGTMALDESAAAKARCTAIAGGELTTVLAPISLSNGLDWVGDRMYYVDSPTKRVDLIDYDGEVRPTAARSRTSRRASACPTGSWSTTRAASGSRSTAARRCGATAPTAS